MFILKPITLYKINRKYSKASNKKYILFISIKVILLKVRK